MSSGNGHRPRPRLFHVLPASAIPVKPVHWLWQDRIALGTLCLMGGREGIGKSLMTYTLAAMLTRGEMPGVYFGTPRSVLVAAAEDSWPHTIVPRLLGAGADCTRVFKLDMKLSTGADATLTLPVDLDELRAAVLETDAALIILDPLLSRIDADLDTHKDADVRRALEPVVTLAESSGACVIGLIHVNKSASVDPLTLLMGSRAFAAVARSVLFVMVDPQNAATRLFGLAKNNLGRMDLPTLSFQIVNTFIASTDDGDVTTGRVDWLSDSPLSIHDAIAATTTTKEEASAVDEASAWLTDYLATGGLDSAKVKRAATSAGHSVRSVQRARSQLAIVVTTIGFPRKTIWTLHGQDDSFIA